MGVETVVARIRFGPVLGDAVRASSLHTAAFSWALARALGGDLVLCVDDLDLAHTAPDRAQAMLDALGWLGIDWDEGPDVGGPHGPYARSRRQERYRAVAAQLVASGEAYRGDDPDTPAGADSGVAVRLRFPNSGQTVVDDALRGSLPFANAALEDPILVDAGGVPQSLLAEVTDDHDMAITHAVADAGALARAPLRAYLFGALGWQAPVWVHLPPVSDATGAWADYAARDFQEGGYLPEALFNYLLLLGWSPPDGAEWVGKWEVRRQFSLDDVTPDPAGFDWNVLKRVNRHYLQQKSDHALAALIAPFLEDAYGEMPTSEAWVVELAGLIRPRLDTLADAVDEAEWAFSDTFLFTEAAEKVLDTESSRPVLVQLVAELARIVLLDQQTAQRMLQSLQHRLGQRDDLSEGAVTRPVRAALTGTVDGPPLPAIMGLLGKQRCLQRIAAVLR